MINKNTYDDAQQLLNQSRAAYTTLTQAVDTLSLDSELTISINNTQLPISLKHISTLHTMIDAAHTISKAACELMAESAPQAILFFNSYKAALSSLNDVDDIFESGYISQIFNASDMYWKDTDYDNMQYILQRLVLAKAACPNKETESICLLNEMIVEVATVISSLYDCQQ